MNMMNKEKKGYNFNIKTLNQPIRIIITVVALIFLFTFLFINNKQEKIVTKSIVSETSTSSESSDIYGGYDEHVSSLPQEDGRNYEKEFYCPFTDNVSNTECLVKNLDILSAIREWKQIKLENLKYPEINITSEGEILRDAEKIKRWREGFETARDLKCGASVAYVYGSGSPASIASCDISEEISALEILDNNYYKVIMSYIDGSKGILDFEPTEKDISNLIKSNKTTRENCCGIW